MPEIGLFGSEGGATDTRRPSPIFGIEDTFPDNREETSKIPWPQTARQ